MPLSQTYNKVIANALISPFDDFCQGSRDPNTYLISLNVKAAKTVKRYGLRGSPFLDVIDAFDKAEAFGAYLGQINLIEVSSFCGPEGIIWGYDVVRSQELCEKPLFVLTQWDGASIPVYDGGPLMAASKSLFGTVSEKRFPLAPGTHCPAAYKSVSLDRPGIAYAACGLGIRDPRDATASILMEDVGVFTATAGKSEADRRANVIRSVAESVLGVAENQSTRCGKIFTLYTEIEVGDGEVGCALSVVPYFSLAGHAVLPGGFERLRSCSLEEWSGAIGRPR